MIRLDRLTGLATAATAVWQSVYEQLAGELMPPDDEPATAVDNRTQ